MNTRLDRRLTARELDDLPHEWDTVYELIGGVLYMAKRPSDLHQEIIARVVVALFPPVDALGGRVLPEPGLVWEEDGDDNVSPDVAVVLTPRGAKPGKLRECPAIAIEVLSPGTENRRRDLEAKRELYWRRGGREYWILDPAETSLLRLTRSDSGWVEELLTASELLRTPVLPEWKGVRVSDLFPT